MCHGIPDKRPLVNGDIVNVDVSVFLDGYHADLNETYVVGEVDDESKHLIKATYDVRDMSLLKSIVNDACAPPCVQYHAAFPCHHSACKLPSTLSNQASGFARYVPLFFSPQLSSHVSSRACKKYHTRAAHVSQPS